MKNATTTTTTSGYSDAAIGAMMKDYQRDCRLGHCGHQACRRKADQRFAAAARTETVNEQPEVAFDTGFDVGATLKDYLRDRRLGHFGLHDETVRSVPARRTRRVRRNSAPVTVILTEDGRFDKQAMRMQRIFGNAPLWS